MKHVAVCVLFAASVASAGPAKNDVSPDQKQAEALFEKGQASYQGGKYQDAIVQFKQAYDLVHDPVYLFNIAQSYRKVADCTAASEYYTKYLHESPTAENKQKVQQWLEELRPCVEQRERDQEAARKSQEEAERLRKERELAQQQQQQQLRSAPPPAEVPVDRGMPLRLGGIALGGVGVAGLAVGIVYGIRGSNIKSDIAAMCAPPNTCQWDKDPIQSLDKQGERANTLATIGYVGGGIAVLAGAALYMLGRSRAEVVTVTPTGGGASVSAQLAF